MAKKLTRLYFARAVLSSFVLDKLPIAVCLSSPMTHKQLEVKFVKATIPLKEARPEPKLLIHPFDELTLKTREEKAWAGNTRKT